MESKNYGIYIPPEVVDVEFELSGTALSNSNLKPGESEGGEEGDVGSLGLFYQWGRKDPFLGAASVSDDVRAVSTGTWEVSNSSISPAVAEQNPMIFYTESYMPNGSWESKKTVYDPCPVGWRVPDEVSISAGRSALMILFGILQQVFCTLIMVMCTTLATTVATGQLLLSLP